MKINLPVLALILGLSVGLPVFSQPTVCPAPVAGDPNCYQTSRPNNGSLQTNWPPIKHQDCCNTIYLAEPWNEIETGSLVPEGASPGVLYPGCVQNELPADINTCFSNNEKATTWFKFKIKPLPGGSLADGAPAGKLRFKIVPKDVLDDPFYDSYSDLGIVNYGETDYDFLLFKIPANINFNDGSACTAIKNSTAYGNPNSVIASCNWTGTKGPTGLFEPGTGTATHQGPSMRFNKPIPVNVGDVFYLAIDNYSVNIQGYVIDFNGFEDQHDSTAVIGGTEKFVKGRAFVDQDANCLPDSANTSFANLWIKNVNGPEHAITDQNGRYDLGLFPFSESVQIKATLPIFAQSYGSIGCPPNGVYSIESTEFVQDTVLGKNFGVDVPDCSIIRVGIGINGSRVCRRGEIDITVRNFGSSPADSASQLVVKLPRHLKFISANASFNFNAEDSTHVFPIGSLGPMGLKKIQIIDSVSCIANLLGIKQCVRAEVVPGNNCAFTIPGWDGVDLSISANCNGNRPRFKIKNKGLAMTSSRNYDVFFGANYVYSQPFILGEQDSLMLEVPTIGNPMVRIETNQSPNHPFSTKIATQISCSGPINPTAMPFAEIPATPAIDVACATLTNSWDPNEKRKSPNGVGPAGNIPPNTTLDYEIHFVNKGNAPAFDVLLFDTLSKHLDVYSLQVLASSHDFTLRVDPNYSTTALRFLFKNINLIDSATNSALARGYVRFRIATKPNLPIGTVIQNTVGIYFDFNPVVITNTTVNTIYEPTFTPGILDSVVVVTDTKKNLKNTGYKIDVFPNPSGGKFTVQTTELSVAEVYTLEGKQIWKSEKRAHDHKPELSFLAKGLYLLKVASDSQQTFRKILIE